MPSGNSHWAVPPKQLSVISSATETGGGKLPSKMKTLPFGRDLTYPLMSTHSPL